MPNLAVDGNSRARSACYPRGSFYPLSDGLSTQHRRITRPEFPLCSARPPHSQATLYPYALQAISIRLEVTFGRLRYLLGGDRPSQTAHLTLSPGTIPYRRLDPQHNKGGIPRAAPVRLAPHLLSLPPILYMLRQRPISGCSKAPRGLSVPLRVTGVFTSFTISPGPPLRQYPDRYAIHAGRNLPDKEFRYLRTVIVTAAVYRGFSSVLRPAKAGLTPRLNLPAPGRRQSLYFGLRLMQRPVFLVNSRLGPVTATHLGSGGKAPSPTVGTPSPEVTGPTCRVP